LGFIARRRDRPSESQVSPRAEWFDRNPALQISGWGSDSVSPHGLTQRFSYTVPSGKKALITLMNVSIMRVLAGTTADIAQINIQLQAQVIILLEIKSNTIGDGRYVGVGTLSLLNAGQTLTGYTFDSSTGGTIAYWMELSLTTFDA